MILQLRPYDIANNIPNPTILGPTLSQASDDLLDAIYNESRHRIIVVNGLQVF